MPIPDPISLREIGYICATLIVIAMLIKDGLIALSAAAAIAGGMTGIEIGRKW